MRILLAVAATCLPVLVAGGGLRPVRSWFPITACGVGLLLVGLAAGLQGLPVTAEWTWLSVESWDLRFVWTLDFVSAMTLAAVLALTAARFFQENGGGGTDADSQFRRRSLALLVAPCGAALTAANAWAELLGWMLLAAALNFAIGGTRQADESRRSLGGWAIASATLLLINCLLLMSQSPVMVNLSDRELAAALAGGPAADLDFSRLIGSMTQLRILAPALLLGIFPAWTWWVRPRRRWSNHDWFCWQAVFVPVAAVRLLRLVDAYAPVAGTVPPVVMLGGLSAAAVVWLPTSRRDGNELLVRIMLGLNGLIVLAAGVMSDFSDRALTICLACSLLAFPALQPAIRPLAAASTRRWTVVGGLPGLLVWISLGAGFPVTQACWFALAASPAHNDLLLVERWLPAALLLVYQLGMSRLAARELLRRLPLRSTPACPTGFSRGCAIAWLLVVGVALRWTPIEPLLLFPVLAGLTLAWMRRVDRSVRPGWSTELRRAGQRGLYLREVLATVWVRPLQLLHRLVLFVESVLAASAMACGRWLLHADPSPAGRSADGVEVERPIEAVAVVLATAVVVALAVWGAV